MKFLLVFLLSFVWLRYFLRTLWLSATLSVAISIVVCAVFFLFRRRKNEKNGLKEKEKLDAENMFLSLACSDTPLDFFEKLLSKKYKEVKTIDDHIIFKQVENDENKINDTKLVFFADLSFEGISVPRFMEIYGKIKKEKVGKVLICCHHIQDKNIFDFLKNFNEKFVIFDQYETYQKLYKEFVYFPEVTHKIKSESKMHFKDFLAYSFNKKRAKGYFFAAFVLVLSGLFVRATIYYCVIASLLVVFALISQFNPYFNKKNTSESI